MWIIFDVMGVIFEVGVSINVFQANVNKYKLDKEYDILFSTGALHYIPKELRKEIFEFEIVGGRKWKYSLIGVKLTDSFLMVPNKSVSGVYFLNRN